MKNLNIKVAVIALGLFLGMSTSAKAQDSDKDNGVGVQSSKSLFDQQLANIAAQQSVIQNRVEQERKPQPQM
ncbi:MAG: hypothetical protein ABI426_10120, partial [Flavobacterium sp.]